MPNNVPVDDNEQDFQTTKSLRFDYDTIRSDVINSTIENPALQKFVEEIVSDELYTELDISGGNSLLLSSPFFFNEKQYAATVWATSTVGILGIAIHFYNKVNKSDDLTFEEMRPLIQAVVRNNNMKAEKKLFNHSSFKNPFPWGIERAKKFINSDAISSKLILDNSRKTISSIFIITWIENNKIQIKYVKDKVDK